jgi:hypothetical protein
MQVTELVKMQSELQALQKGLCDHTCKIAMEIQQRLLPNP